MEISINQVGKISLPLYFIIMSVFGTAALSSLGESVGSVATGAAGGLFGSLTARRQAKRNFKYQQRLNEQVFQHNKQLAEQQNQMNIDQWNRENEYNTPLAQAQRLQAAGLNPDLVAQGLGGLSAQSPTLTAGTPYPTTDVASLQNAANNTASTILGGASSMAQTASNIQSQDSMTNYFNKVKAIRAQLEKGQLTAQGIQIQLMGFDFKELKPLEKRKLIRECDRLEQESANYKQIIDESKAKVQLLNAQEQGEMLDNLFNAVSFDTRVATLGQEFAKLVFDTKVSEQQAQHYGAYMLAQIWNLNATAASAKAQEAYTKVQTEIAEKTKDNKISVDNTGMEVVISQNEIKKDNAQVIFWIDQTLGWLGQAAEVASGWKNFLKKPKATSTTSTTRRSNGSWSQTHTYTQ